MVSEGRGYIEKTFKPGRPLYYHEWVPQLCPVVNNAEQVLTTVAADADFIASNVALGVPTGFGEITSDISLLERALLVIVGRAVNSFAGLNYLDCTAPTDNLWQVNINGGAYTDLQNDAKADGQMLDTDWLCVVQGAIHPFLFVFDITGLITAVTNRIGLRLQNARSFQNNLVVTADVSLKCLWRL